MGRLGPDLEEVVAVEQLGLGQTVPVQAEILLLLQLRQVQMQAQPVVDGVFCHGLPQLIGGRALTL